MGIHHTTPEVTMSNEKPKPSIPINYTLHNTETKVSVQHMVLVPHDVDVLNKVFVKHKIPLRFIIEP